MGTTNKQLSNFLDKGGKEYAIAYRHAVLSQRINLFKYDKWPFRHQDQAELETYLYDFGAVAVIDLEGDKFFIPISLSKTRKRITKLNYKDISVKVIGEFSKYIADAFDMNSEEYKKELPFIFDNPNQISPKDNQEILFQELKNVFNANHSNRINKNKQSILEVENGQALQAAILAQEASENYSPFMIVEKNPSNKDQPVKAENVKQLTTSAPDLYNSYSTERKEIEKIIQVMNGIRGSQSQEKSSAQETDSQTTTQDRDIANVLSVLIKQRKDDLKRIRSIFGVDISVDLRETIKNFMDSVDLQEALDLAQNVEKEPTGETEQKDSLLERIKNWFTRTTPDTTEDGEEEDD